MVEGVRQASGYAMNLLRNPGGGTDLERGYGDVRPWWPPFHATPVARKGSISSKRVSSQDPLLRKFGNFSLSSLNFHPNFSSQAPNLEIFRSQAPLFRGKCQFASPTLRKSGSHTPTWKKVECPPPPGFVTNHGGLTQVTYKLAQKSFASPGKKCFTSKTEDTKIILCIWPYLSEC